MEKQHTLRLPFLHLQNVVYKNSIDHEGQAGHLIQLLFQTSLSLAHVNYKLALATGTCHLALQGFDYVLLHLLIFSNPLKGDQGGDQE